MTQTAIPNTVRTECELLELNLRRQPFAYSYRCVLCRQGVEHTEEQHDILRHGWAL